MKKQCVPRSSISSSSDNSNNKNRKKKRRDGSRATRKIIASIVFTCLLSFTNVQSFHSAAPAGTYSRCHRHRPVTASSTATATILRAEFVSCAGPRFDVFSEKLLGEWQWQDDNDDVVISSEQVQEVMRSCGGAVQGIREVPAACLSGRQKSNNNDEPDLLVAEGYYLNRANDGFIYFDKDGSYSCGPTRIKTTANSNKEDDDIWISSLSFGTSRRLIVAAAATATRGHDDDDKEDTNYNIISFSSQQQRMLQVSRKKGPATTEKEVDVAKRLAKKTIIWTDIIQTRMPSTSQPWMMQRLKWEQLSQGASNYNDDDDDDDKSDPKIYGWLSFFDPPGSSSSSSENDVRSAYLPAAALLDTVETASVVWCATGVSGATVKSVVRQYRGDDGSLQGVSWCRGYLVEEEEE